MNKFWEKLLKTSNFFIFRRKQCFTIHPVFVNFTISDELIDVGEDSD